MFGIVELIMIVFFSGIYFLPSILAKVNKQPKFIGIVIVNTLLGWTLIGWAISFLWAFPKEDLEGYQTPQNSV